MENLKTAAGSLGIALSGEQIAAFEAYADELSRQNEEFNLTSIVERSGIETKHFLDSLTILPALEGRARILDIGTGAGFPGLPLKIAEPRLDLTLVDASAKKASFVAHMIALLGLENARALHGRAEDLAREPLHRERYDAVLSRAVANLATLAEYSLPFAKVGGIVIAQKIATEEETGSAESAIGKLGGKLREIRPIDVPGLQGRHLVIIDKVAPTPDSYPRRTGIPLKRPL